MALKKSELYSSLWKSCDELRGGMDASQYKNYILALLFVKYVSDKHADNPDSLIEVPEGGGFADMVKLIGDKEIGDKMNKIVHKLAETNELKGIFDDADFNDPDKLGKDQAMVDRLSKLIAIFNNPALDFRGNHADGDDLLGDAYEYLMRHFATESGKSKGQFYTPAEVSRVMAKVIGMGSASRPDQTIYDPTCGSGSLLLKAHDEAKARTGFDLAMYGQEKDNSTLRLARMNMILHDCPTAELWQDDTLASPYFKQSDGDLKTFDYVVANPPFSSKAWSNGLVPHEDAYARFVYGVPPTKNGDYAFLLHVLKSLKSTGKGAVILPHGVLFRGGSESAIRRKLVTQGYIKGIIGLPANLFYGTGIPACIIVLDKENASGRRGIFMIDASQGFIKDGNKNRLRAQDIHKIVDIFTTQTEIPGYARMVPLSEISDEKNDYNLNLPRYIDNTETEDVQDIDAHLRGGIPVRDIDALERYWKVLPGIRTALLEAADRPGYRQLKVDADKVKSTIFEHPEFAQFQQSVTSLFDQWKTANIQRLKSITPEDSPKALIDTISEEMLSIFREAPLLDAYDVYQHLMDYWEETMQDDMYMIVGDGWVKAAQPRVIVKKKGEKNTEKPDFTIGKKMIKVELIPPSLLIHRYFSAQQAAIEELDAKRDALVAQMEELAEEHTGDEGLLVDALTDAGKLTGTSVKARLKEIKGDADAAEERKLLKAYLTLSTEESNVKKESKEATEALHKEIFEKYINLTDDEVKTLVVEDKWLATLSSSVQNEMERVSQRLAARIRQLAERYQTPLPQLVNTIESLSQRVDEHLKRMGLSW